MKLPLTFHVQADTENGIQRDWTLKSGQFSTTCSIPTEFEGPGTAASPEDFFAQALTSCFIGTFKVYAAKSNIQFERLETAASIDMDMDEGTKQVVVKNFKLVATVTKPSNAERATMLANRAFKSGFILNSVKCKLEFEIKVKD